MKTLRKPAAAFSVCLLIVGSPSGYAQEESSTKDVGETIHRYYRAMETRDVEALQQVLHPTFIGIESGRGNAKVHIINTSDTSKLLPPDGNNDWENLTLKDLNVIVSSTHPSVATVSYSVFHPTDPRIVEMLQDELKVSASELDEVRRNEISTLLAAKGSTESECAMLALCDGKWRIVCLSVPR